jgi:hypothetical protein
MDRNPRSLQQEVVAHVLAPQGRIAAHPVHRSIPLSRGHQTSIESRVRDADYYTFPNCHSFGKSYKLEAVSN